MRKQLKFAILSIHSSPVGLLGTKDTGGMSTYLLGLSRALADNGHQVDIYTRATTGINNSITTLYPNVRLILIADGLGSLTKYALRNHAGSIADRIKAFWQQGQLQYDLLFSHYWISGLVGCHLKLKCGLPHLLMFHTLGRAKNELCSGESEPPIRLQAEEELAGSADLLVVAAQSERQRMLEYFRLKPEKIQVVTAGIDRAIFSSLDHRAANHSLDLGSDQLILAVGRLEPVKGFDLLLEAAALIKPAAFKAVIVGGDQRDRHFEAALKQKAARLNLNAQLLFAGPVDYANLPDYYRAAAVTVIPSCYESFGLVALESLSCGTPVIAGPVGVIPELAAIPGSESYVHLIANRSPKLWAEKIRELINKAPWTGSETYLDDLFAIYNWTAAAKRLTDIIHTLNEDQL